MNKKVLITATVQSHICQFHKPLITMLKRNGYEVHVAAKDNLYEKSGLRLDYVDKIFDVPFERSPIKKENIFAYRELKRIVRENNYDIIHCNTPMGGIIARIVAIKYRKNGLKVIYTAHGFHFFKGGPKKSWILYYPIEKIMARITDVLITINKEDYNLAIDKKFKTKVFYINGVGVNNNKFKCISDLEKKQLRLSEGFNKEDYIVICVGELNDNKNQKVIIRAIQLLKEKICNIKLLLAGNGYNYEKLRKQVKELGIEDIVTFLGYRVDIEKFICLSDVVVSASYREGLPLNIMEAMTAEKPVIASINRGHNELIKNGENGFLVSADNVKEYCEKIDEIYRCKGERDYIIQNAKKNIKKYYFDSIDKQLEKIYLSL